MAINPIPEGFHAITPYLILKDAARAIDFYKEVFGATELMRMADAGGRVAHAEMKIGDSAIMLADEPDSSLRGKSPHSLGDSTVVLSIYVPNADETVARMVAAGSKLLAPVEDRFYGDRCGRVEDPFGHIWIVGTHVEDMSAEEMNRRFESWKEKQGRS
ncbi:MAG: glyoxalase [Blastocatellia bacterium AA13]|nr:MAG: glyoxalase [Blastocatellia bacterium AA13]